MATPSAPSYARSSLTPVLCTLALALFGMNFCAYLYRVLPDRSEPVVIACLAEAPPAPEVDVRVERFLVKPHTPQTEHAYRVYVRTLERQAAEEALVLELEAQHEAEALRQHQAEIEREVQALTEQTARLQRLEIERSLEARLPKAVPPTYVQQ